MALVFFKRAILIPSTAPHGGVVAIEQAGVCGSGAITTEDSFFHLDEYYERICLKNRGRYVALSGPSGYKGFC